MAVHRILVQRNQHVELVAHAADRAVAGADGQKRVPAANDGLVSVVGVDVQAAPREDAGENITGGGDALAVLAANANCKINCCHDQFPFLLESCPKPFVPGVQASACATIRSRLEFKL